MTAILYDCRGSRGLRALWAAEEIGFPLDLRMLPFPPRARAAGFLELNPLGTVPLLIDGDVRMTESCAIAQYIATRGGPTPLAVMPEDADYGAFLDFLHHGEATLTFPQTVYLRFCRMEKDRGLAEAGEAYRDWFAARLAKVEERLDGREYLCAGRFTAADIAVGYALLLARMIGLGELLPQRTAAYLDRLAARPALARARAREEAPVEG